MGGPNDSMSSTKGSGKKNPPDEQKWHVGRQLCYHWKKDHTYLRDQVDKKTIVFNTQFDLEIEHCEMERNEESMSLRPSKQGGAVFDRYKRLTDQFRELVDTELSVTEHGEPMWKFEVLENEQRTLLPRDMQAGKKKARLGSMEVILSWKSAGLDNSRKEVVLFSKLNTLKFPHPKDIVKYLKNVLAPARMLDFEVHVRRVPEGTPYEGAIAEVDVQAEDPIRNTTNRKGVVDLRLPFGKDFEVVARGKDKEPMELRGVAKFDVHGDLPKSICMPLVPVHALGEVRIVLTWGEFPHDLVLKVKTPEGAIQTPGQRTSAEEADALQGKEKLVNAEYEVRPEEGGFGPISVLLRQLLPGRYHVYAKCKPYDFAGKKIGWPDSNAQIHMYGHEQEALQWKGDFSYKCEKDVDPEEQEGKIFWNVCFFDVNANGHVKVTDQFNEYVAEEPGFRECTIICKDLQGQRVQGATVKIVSESAAYQDMGPWVKETGSDGVVVVSLPLGEFTAQVSHDKYLPSGAKIAVDLDPQIAEATIAMVNSTYFGGTDNKLIVLTWGGTGTARLHVETPGRLFENLKPGSEDQSYNAIPPQQSMKMRGSNPVGCMLTPPDPNLCPWANPEKTPVPTYTDRIYVEYENEHIDKVNMQVNIFTKDGILYQANPPAAVTDEQKGKFWRVCEISNGEVLQQDERVIENPATGDIFAVRVLTARDLESEDSAKPSPEVIIAKQGDALPVRKYVEALERDSSEFTVPLEYKLFMPYGTYNIEAKDESWIMGAPSERNTMSYDNLFFESRTFNSLGLCMASQEDLDAKSLFISLTWADQPKDLDLCVGHADGVVSSQNRASAAEGKPGNAPKGVTYITSHDSGYGPKVISVMQPISAKLRVYVIDRSKQDPKAFLKSFPMVNIIFYNQIWKSFTVKVPGGADSMAAALDAKAEAGKGLGCCWHVCDLRLEQDTKMSEQCVECIEVNELLDTELKAEGTA